MNALGQSQERSGYETEIAPAPVAIAAPRKLFFVGLRYSHHARHSGYEGFGRYMGKQLHPVVKFRYLKFRHDPELGWKIDEWVGRKTHRKFFSVALLLTELGAAMHMLWHRRAVYHVLYGDTDVWMLGRVAQLTGNRVVVTFHEPEEDLESLITAELAQSLHGIVLVSEVQRPFFERLAPASRIFVVPHGVDTEYFHPASERHPQPTCITVGGHLRDFETLAAAIDLVLAERPDVRFVGVGTNRDKDRPPFRHPRMEHLDGISDAELRAQYQSAWAGVYCFNSVTANNAILETMACGVPVVVTDTGGIREYVNERAAVLCPPKSPEAIARGLLKVISDEKDTAGRRRSARERAREFDYRITAVKMAEMYAKVAGR